MQRLATASRDTWPTEVIPDGIEIHTDEEDPFLQACLDLASLDIEVDDRLNTYHGRPRMVRDCKDREWSHSCRVAIRKHHGERISFRPQEITSDAIDTASAAETLRFSVESVNSPPHG